MFLNNFYGLVTLKIKCLIKSFLNANFHALVYMSLWLAWLLNVSFILLTTKDLDSILERR
jgi:hypothetical protein